MVLKLLPLVLGAWLVYAGLGSLALPVFGERVDALVDETAVKAVKEIPARDGAPSSYAVRAKVSYHFEICPRSGAGGCVHAEGSDTMILRAPSPVLARDRGYAVPVLFLRPAPGVNAVRQPRHLAVYGLLQLLLGLGIAAFEIKVLLRQRRARLAAAAPAGAPASAPADPYHELGRPLSPESLRGREPDDIRPS
jgi:hypothetical protein